MSQTKKCPKCAEDIAISAKKCKHCHADLRNWFVRHKILTVLLGIVLLSVLSSAIVDNENKKPYVSSDGTVTEVVNNQKVIDFEISSSDLFDAYSKNEISADEKYKNKILKVNGVVDTIAKDFLDNMYITLKTNEMFGNVQCMLKDDEVSKASNLSKGQSIVVVGKNSGKLMNVVLNNCEIK